MPGLRQEPPGFSSVASTVDSAAVIQPTCGFLMWGSEFMGLALWRSHKGQEQGLRPMKDPAPSLCHSCFKHFFPKINSNFSSSLETPGKGRAKGNEAEDRPLLPSAFCCPEPIHGPMAVATECSQKALLRSRSGLVAAEQGGGGGKDSGIPPGILEASGS